VQYRLSKVR